MNNEETFVSDSAAFLSVCFFIDFFPLVNYLQTIFCFMQTLHSAMSNICTFYLFISPDFGIADHFINRAVNVNYISNHCPIFKNLTDQKKWAV